MTVAGNSDIESIEGKTVRVLVSSQAKRSFNLFKDGVLNNDDEEAALHASQQRKLACKLRDEYAALREGPYQSGPVAKDAQAGTSSTTSAPSTTGWPAKSSKTTSTSLIISDIEKNTRTTSSDAEAGRKAREALSRSKAVVTLSDGTKAKYEPSVAVARRLSSRWPRPEWHPPWRVYRTIAGHLGWVRSIAFDPGNEWFATGSGDRTIKIWDTASGELKLTLTGHIEQVTGLAVSDKFPYMFSCGLDKKVMCWDLEQNKVIRHYHGHLSGVYSLAIHPELPLLMTGGRDSTCRLWDMRTRLQVFAMEGHQSTVASIITHAVDPQVITGSHDNTIRLWDIKTGKTTKTLTYHKHSVRALAMSPNEYAFLGASSENIKKYTLPDGEFSHNMIQRQQSIINCMAINDDGVVASGGDNGTLWFWDWRSGNCFQTGQTVPQPGSLDSEAGIFAMAFDKSGSRLVTCEADKSIKMWKEDPDATEATHPVDFRPPKDVVRRY